ncbi:NTP transferase domain-containing protein [Candidatus Woesearchaeota archaeon]|nr:NTP transferase domain-containing protein [Candidatus Woesearchaeota archaeon]
MARIPYAVILAAGRSTRTEPLTSDLPKPLLRLGEKNLLEWNLDSLAGLVDEAVIVVGFRKEKIRRYFGGSHNGIRLTYVEQTAQRGTGDAVRQAEQRLSGRFLILMGDDLYGRTDVERMLRHGYAVLARPAPHPERFGVYGVDDDLYVTKLVEKPAHPPSEYVNNAMYLLDTGIFTYLRRVTASERGEIELTDAVHAFAQDHRVKLVVGKDYWLPIGYPWSLLDAKERLYGARSIIASGIGPSVTVERSLIGRGCTIGDNVTIADSIIMDGVSVADGSRIESSVLMGGVVLKGALTTECAAVGPTVSSDIKGIMTDSGRERLGCVLGEKVTVESDCVTAPGVKAWPGTRIPGPRLSQDLHQA